MDEEIVMTIKAEIAPATKQVEGFTKSLTDAEKAQKELNEQITIQNQVLTSMEKELVQLKAKQDSIPKGAWYAGMDDLNKKIKETETNLKLEKIGLKDLENQQKDNNKVLKEQSKDLKGVKKDLKGVNEEAKDSVGNFKIMGVSLNGVKAAFGKIIPLAKLMFGTIRAGMISTGIGALLVAFGSLVAYFTSTQIGVDKLRLRFVALSTTINVLKDRLSTFGSGLSIMLKGGINNMIIGSALLRTSFSDLGKEVNEEIKIMTALEQRLFDLRDAEHLFMVQKAKTRQEVEKARLIAEDETKSQEVRIAALKNALELEKKTTEQELVYAKERRDIAKEQMATARNLDAAKKDLAEKEADVINKQTKSFRMQKRVQTEINQLERELLAEKNQRTNDQAALDKENQAKSDQYDADQLASKKSFEEKLLQLKNAATLLLIEDEKERALKQLEFQEEMEKASIDSMDITENQKIALKKATTEKFKLLSKENAETDKKSSKIAEISTQDQIDSYANLTGALVNLAGENKQLAVAQAIIDTFAAGNKALSSAPPPLNYINMAAVIATGFANVKSIMGQDIGGGISGGSIPTGISSIPAPEMLSGKFELGNIQEQQPVQAYVVTDSLTDNQNKLAYIRRRATI